MLAKRALSFLALAGVVLLGALVLVLRSWRQSRPEPRSPAAPRNSGIDAPAPESWAETSTPEGARLALDAEVPPGPGPGQRHERAARPTSTLDVLVREGDGRPAGQVELALAATSAPHPDGYPLPDPRDVRRQARTDADGRAMFAGLEAGSYTIVGKARDGRRVRRRFGSAPGRAVLELVLPSSVASRELAVRVTGVDGRPVAGARVEATGAVVDLGLIGMDDRAPAAATTDPEGLARFEGQELDGVVLLASAPDGRVGKRELWLFEQVARELRSGPIQVIVDRAGTLAGALVGLPPETLSGASVIAYATNNPFRYHTTHWRAIATPVEGGSYRFDGLAAGAWTLALADPGGARLVLPPLEYFGSLPNSIDPLEVEVRAGATTRQDLAVARGAILVGRVRTADGRPVPGAEVRTTQAPSTSNFPDGFTLHGVNVWRYDSPAPGDHPLTHGRARTDAEGRYRLAGLQPGRLRVEVLATGLSYDRREDVPLEEGVSSELAHVLQPAGGIEGVDPDGGYLGLRKLGEERLRMIAILPPDGDFSFPGLEAADWELLAVHSDASIAPVPMRVVEVVAGETTWVDLRQVEFPVRIAGRVLGIGGPISGAEVIFRPDRLATDAQGRFATTRPFPLAAVFDPLPIEVATGGVHSEFGFLPREDGGWEGDLRLGTESLVVRTFGPDGAAARCQVRFEIVEEEAQPTSSAEPRLRRVHGSLRVDGEVTIVGLPAGRTCQLFATFESGAEAAGTVLLPARGPSELREPASGDLEILVRRNDGVPAPEAFVSAWTWRGAGEPPTELAPFAEGAPLREGRTDDAGRLLLRGVRAGVVWLRAEDGSNHRWEEARAAAERRFLLGPDETSTVEVLLDEAS